jgi:hypothetical protein
VDLVKPIPLEEKTTFDMVFKGPVPVKYVDRRNNADGVALSMSQWYPKLAEPFEGWHADPYIT